MGGLDALDYTLLITAATAGFGYFYFKKQNAPKIPEKLSDLRSKTNANSLIKYLNSLGKEQLVILFYGSQTGTAEDFATRTQNDISSRLDIPTVLIDPEDYDLEDLKEIDQSKDWVCGFFMATYGEGEPTDNSTEFYDWVMNGQGQMADKGDQEDEMVEDQVLQGLSYFVFGLGNKTYEYYNAIGRRLDKRLAQLGANRIGTYGEGDDDDSLEGDYLKWAPTLVKSLAEHFQVKEKISDGSAPHIPLFHAVAREHAPEEGTRILAKGPKDCRILHSRILFKDSFDKYSFSDETKVVVKSDKATVEGNTVVIPRQCYHVEFDVSGMKYTTGDHLGVYASNNAGSVAKLAKFLGFRDSDICFDLIPNPEHRLHETAKANIDSPFHLCNVLTHRLDIESILKQHHFEVDFCK